MYIDNGFVCGEIPMDSVKISCVKPLSNMIILLTFSNGETRLFDATVLNGEAFEPLKDDNVFKNPTIDHGVVTWLNGEIDISPEFMYENSYVYNTMTV